MIYYIQNLNLIDEARTPFQGEFEGYNLTIEVDGNNTETNFQYDPYFKIYE